MNSFDEQYRVQPAFVRAQSCEAFGEHTGDSFIQLTTEPEAVECWTCCDERTTVGEVFDCDDCLESGVRYHGQNLPAGWIEDSNGFHCTKCTPQEWRNAA